MYDQKLDRMDVAVKAVLFLYRTRKWAQLHELGIERTHAGALEAALTSCETSLKRWREAEVFAAVAVCPLLVEAAVVLQTRYQARSRA